MRIQLEGRNYLHVAEVEVKIAGTRLAGILEREAEKELKLKEGGNKLLKKQLCDVENEYFTRQAL